MTKEEIISKKLEQLSTSNFRNRFCLTTKDIQYIMDKGMQEMVEHAYSFIKNRLAPKEIVNDGKQTPMKGHPVFIAQHATGTCCRSCLLKWHYIAKNKALSDNEINYIVSILIAWMKRQIEMYKK